MTEKSVDAVGEWLSSAEKEVEVARLLIDSGHVEAGAFHTHQALEKSLKAELIRMGVRPRKTHDLDYLADQLGRPGELTAIGLTAASLWAITGRYVFALEELPRRGEVEAALVAAGLYLERLRRR